MKAILIAAYVMISIISMLCISMATVDTIDFTKFSWYSVVYTVAMIHALVVLAERIGSALTTLF